MNGLKKILGSYKGVAFIVVILIVGVLVGLGKVTYEQFVEFVKWAFGTLAIARAGEEGLKGLGGKSPMKSR